jgi:DNA-binding transcriptional regulator YiaG
LALESASRAACNGKPARDARQFEGFHVIKSFKLTIHSVILAMLVQMLHLNWHNAAMPNIATILKSEISRVARKEVRAEIESLKKASVQHRAAIAALRRQVSALEKELRNVAKGAARSARASEPDEADDGGTKRRFSAGRLASHRTKLGISAASYGKLVGVSGQTIYHWEPLGARQGAPPGSAAGKPGGGAGARQARSRRAPRR